MAAVGEVDLDDGNAYRQQFGQFSSRTSSTLARWRRAA